MKTWMLRPAILLVLLAIPLAGCFHADRTVSPATPESVGSPGQATVLGLPVQAPGPMGNQPLSVTRTLGPQGGVIAVGRIAVTFPAGSLPLGPTAITLTAWGSGDAYYFTVEPRSLMLARPVGFSYKLGGTSGDGLTYSWNDFGWLEPLPSKLSPDGTLLLSGADFLGEFVVAPLPPLDGGRAGW